MTKWYEGSGGSGEQMAEIVKKSKKERKTYNLEIPDDWICIDESGTFTEEQWNKLKDIMHKKPELACEWVDDLAKERITTSCGNTYWDRELYYGFKFCGWCGKEIKYEET